MVNQSIQEEILNQLDKLPIEQQAQVLDFARALTRPEGRQGKDLLHFAGGLNLEDLSLMTQAIERDCDRSTPMTGSFLLDTNIVIALFAKEAVVQANLANAAEVFIPSIVLGDL